MSTQNPQAVGAGAGADSLCSDPEILAHKAELPLLSPRLGKRPGIGIVHLGLGAFFRAHGVLYIAEAMSASGGDWGIVGVSLMRPDLHDMLAPQGYAYSTVELGPEGESIRRVDAVQNVLVASESPADVLELMSDPKVRIVTLTVTEKGYCHSPSTGALKPDHPHILHDLAHPAAPRSAPGYLVRALALRRSRGLRPFTVLCCDNLPQNGSVVRGVVLELSRLVDPQLADWIAAEGAFPSTMVDRIVPACRPEDVAMLAARTGVLDRAPVMHEPFRQWVVEDLFVNAERPDLAAVGVELVADVRPFEHMKLRCLNGTHSALAYLGYLAGHDTIAKTVADPAFAGFVRHLWLREIIPGLNPPPGVNLPAYTEELFARYSNPAICHRTWQIAMDGSQKLPQRILGTICDGLAAGRPVAGLTLAVAAWMRYVGGVDENGAAIEVSDPLAQRLRALSDGAPDAAGKVAALLTVGDIFPAGLAANNRFRTAVVQEYSALLKYGAREAVARLVR